MYLYFFGSFAILIIRILPFLGNRDGCCCYLVIESNGINIRSIFLICWIGKDSSCFIAGCIVFQLRYYRNCVFTIIICIWIIGPRHFFYCVCIGLTNIIFIIGNFTEMDLSIFVIFLCLKYFSCRC